MINVHFYRRGGGERKTKMFYKQIKRQQLVIRRFKTECTAETPEYTFSIGQIIHALENPDTTSEILISATKHIKALPSICDFIPFTAL